MTFVANYDELLSQGESIRRNLDNPIQTFTVVALIYIAINYCSRPARQYLQRRHPRRDGRWLPAETLDAENQVPIAGLDGRRLTPLRTTRHTRPHYRRVAVA